MDSITFQTAIDHLKFMVKYWTESDFMKKNKVGSIFLQRPLENFKDQFDEVLEAADAKQRSEIRERFSDLQKEIIDAEKGSLTQESFREFVRRVGQALDGVVFAPRVTAEEKKAVAKEADRPLPEAVFGSIVSQKFQHKARLKDSERTQDALSSTTDKILGFPTMGRYGIDAVLRGAQWITVSSRAGDKKIFDFMQIQLGLLKSTDVTLVNTPFHARIDEAMTNFFRLFEEGRSLMKIRPLKGINPSDALSFVIRSPGDLLEANLALMDLAERIIFQGLFPSQTGEPSEVQRLRITQTKFLGPLILSKMTGGDISNEEALLLTACLGLQKNNRIIYVCDPATGNFHKDFQASMLTSKSSYKLIFLDPERLLQSLPVIAYDPNKDCDDTLILFEATKLIAKTVLGIVEGPFSSLSKSAQQKLAKELMDASVDHEEVLAIIDRLETYFPCEQRDDILKCKILIGKETQRAFEICGELVKNLPTQKGLDDALKNIEARARFTKASKQKNYLEDKFNRFKDVIVECLKLLSQEYKIATPRTFDIKWKVQGIEIEETMEITETCAITRRVHFQKNPESDRRSDLVYFSSNDQVESVVSNWEELCRQHSLSDRQLAVHLLSLYQGNEIPDQLTPFLSFLMILLLGKEPAYDSASFAANFILLFSIKLGVHSFKDALGRMPMIPQGSIAAKQFLLHVSGKPLDALARVQYKSKKLVPESTFLPTSASFLGPAKNKIQVYDDVATTALECCRRLFFQDIDPENPHLVQLQADLKDVSEIWDIPISLNLFSEWRKHFRNPADAETLQLLVQKNKCAARFLCSMGQIVGSVKSRAAEQCARFLMRGVDLSDPRIQELQQIIDKQEKENWQARMVSQLERSEDLYYEYEAMKKTIMDWDPFTVFQTQRIDPYDYSAEGIRKMNKAWDDYFMQCMSSYQTIKDFDELRAWALNNYRIPISYYELASAIDPDNSVNDEDPLAKWAISYILDRHPLRR